MTTIPYTTEARADTGLTNVTLGVWLFLASEVMLFGALFSCYALLRVAADIWPSGRDVLNLSLGAANTVVLMTLTVFALMARSRPLPVARRLLVGSTAMGVVFLAIKSIEWRAEIAAGLLPSTNTFLAMYFTLTGLHALHVVGGLVANLWTLAGRAGEPMTVGRVRALALYWGFVEIVWLIIFGLMYL